MTMITEKEKIEEPKPAQKSALVFGIFYALGTVSYVPSAFYVTANDYWMYKFRNPNETNYNGSDSAPKTTLQTNFTSYYTIVSNISMVIGLAASVFLIKKFSPYPRIVVTVSTLVCLLVMTIIFAWIDTDSWQTEFFIISLIIAMVLNFTGACFLLSIFHLAMKFPPVYLGAVLSGQSICGILSSLIQIVTLAIGSSSMVNASLYFVIGTLSLAVVLVVFVTVLTKQQYYKDQVNKKEEQEKLKINRQIIFNIIKKISVILASMVFAAGMMVSLYPGVTSLVESTDKGYGKWGDTFFVPVCSFFAYNLSEFIGRECSFRFTWITNQWVLFAFAVLRVVGLVPALLFCNIQPRNHLSVVFGEDWEYAIVIFVLAFTGGYVMNLCIVTMPRVCNTEEMQIASVLVVLAMVASLSVCSFFGPILIALV